MEWTVGDGRRRDCRGLTGDGRRVEIGRDDPPFAANDDAEDS
ncbi:MAG TPA: hypothetical protein VE136_15560 [Anaerolineales bacterium]|nr:hypothetical protein [Anaerolineales bacterium]